MIRTILFAAIAFAAASPALAFQQSSAPAPKGGDAAFFHLGAVERLAPAGVDDLTHDGRSSAARAPMVVYTLPKGKPADRIDVTNPRDNPFMPQPERTPAPAPAR